MSIRTKPATDAYRNGWEETFGHRKPPEVIAGNDLEEVPEHLRCKKVCVSGIIFCLRCGRELPDEDSRWKNSICDHAIISSSLR